MQLRSILLASGAVAALASSAGAVTISGTDMTMGTPFASLAPTTSSDTRLLTASEPTARSPFEGTAFPDASFYAVQKNGSATYSFDTPQDGFSLLWGSPDSYNSLVFTSAGSTFSFTGSDVIAATPGSTVGGGFVNVNFAGMFDSVTFSSGGVDAFEFANVAVAPVPLPAGVLLMGTALAGFGALRRKAKARA